MRSLQNLNRLRFPVLIGLTPFFIAFYASVFYPGYLTADSIYMLSQGSGQQLLTNWHPPFIVLIWGKLFSLYKSAGGVWLIQISLYIAAVMFFSMRLRNFFLSVIAFILLLVYPPIFTNMGALWKDCWVISTTLLCAAYSIEAINQKKLKFIIFTGIFFLISMLIRVDYAIIAAPFVISALFFGIPVVSISDKKRNILFCILVFVFCTILVNQLIGSFVTQRLNPWLNTAIWDIVGIENYSGSHGPVDGYICSTSDALVFGPHKMFNINLPQQALITDSAVEAERFSELWINNVLKEPSAYLKHRFCVAKTFLGMGTPEVHYPYPRAEMSLSSFTQRSERSQLNIDLYWFFDSNAFGPMYRYWYYLVFTSALLTLSVLYKKVGVVEVSIFLSILLSASRFIILPATDFRYGIWMIVGSITLTLFFLDSRAMRGTIHVVENKDS